MPYIENQQAFYRKNFDIGLSYTSVTNGRVIGSNIKWDWLFLFVITGVCYNWGLL